MDVKRPADTETAAALIGESVRNARIRLDLSKAEAARRAGVSRRTWHEVEEGQRVTATAATLAQFDQVLQLPEGTLYAMTAKSNHAKIEELRRRALQLVRTMTGDELDLLLASGGSSTLLQRLDKLDADIAELRRRDDERTASSPPARGARSH